MSGTTSSSNPDACMCFSGLRESENNPWRPTAASIADEAHLGIAKNTKPWCGAAITQPPGAGYPVDGRGLKSPTPQDSHLVPIRGPPTIDAVLSRCVRAGVRYCGRLADATRGLRTV